MISYLLYLAVIFLILIFIISVAIYLLGLIYSSLRGSPYVPTKRKILQDILKKSGLKKGETFIDIGCGDGRVVEIAAELFQANAVGIDINPLLIWRARFRALLKPQSNRVGYSVANINNYDFKKFKVIYVFLMPELIDKISHKLEKAVLNKSTIISHGFKVNRLEKYLKETIPSKTFPTYIYKSITQKSK
jgi:SAM-dependent methyltransferase